MNIADLTKRQLFGSLDKSKIPGTLADYHCELIIEEYQQVSLSLLRDAYTLKKYISNLHQKNSMKTIPSSFK